MFKFLLKYKNELIPQLSKEPEHSATLCCGDNMCGELNTDNANQKYNTGSIFFLQKTGNII